MKKYLKGLKVYLDVVIDEGWYSILALITIFLSISNNALHWIKNSVFLTILCAGLWYHHRRHENPKTNKKSTTMNVFFLFMWAVGMLLILTN